MPGEPFTWVPPPSWPIPPEGWVPPAEWEPPPEWPPAPEGWIFWRSTSPRRPVLAPSAVTGLVGTSLSTRERRSLRLETTFVMLAFLLPGVVTAVVVLSQHVVNGGSYQVLPTIVTGNPVLNLLLGILDYLPVAAVVPLALLLLTRSGQPPRSLGLGWPSPTDDLLPGLGLAAGAFGTELLLAAVLAPLFTTHSKAVNTISIHHVPGYYVLWGLSISFVTAVTEEVLVNGYLLTRLSQLGWHPWAALALSLVLRTSYHVYYGVGFLLTVPFGYYATRSFQKHGRLNRAIAGHFLYDATVFSIAILMH